MAVCALYVAVIVANIFIYHKMGFQGWEAIVPIYNLYVLCEELYGDGWKVLFFLIPFYNIYFTFKVNIDLARGFGKDSGFGVGLALLPVVFKMILGFNKSEYIKTVNNNTVE